MLYKMLPYLSVEIQASVTTSTDRRSTHIFHMALVLEMSSCIPWR